MIIAPTSAKMVRNLFFIFLVRWVVKHILTNSDSFMDAGAFMKLLRRRGTLYYPGLGKRQFTVFLLAVMAVMEKIWIS